MEVEAIGMRFTIHTVATSPFAMPNLKESGSVSKTVVIRHNFNKVWIDGTVRMTRTVSDKTPAARTLPLCFCAQTAN
jgi:hypothetical protein